jgi:cell pole-organizing protein PopZ
MEKDAVEEALENIREVINGEGQKQITHIFPHLSTYTRTDVLLLTEVMDEKQDINKIFITKEAKQTENLSVLKAEFSEWLDKNLPSLIRKTIRQEIGKALKKLMT